MPAAKVKVLGPTPILVVRPENSWVTLCPQRACRASGAVRRGGAASLGGPAADFWGELAASAGCQS